MAHVALIGAETEENLALRYIESSLASSGHSTVIIPFNSRHDIERCAKTIAGSGAGIAGLSMVFTARAREFADLAAAARSAGYTGHITAGGHFAAFNAEVILNDMPSIDSVAVGEGESIMINLAGSLENLSIVDGLIWRAGDGSVVKNSVCVPPADLDSLPYPTHKHPPDTYHGLPVANILSSRGCTSSCSFCSISAWHRMCGGERLRLRDPEHIAREMAALYRQGYRIFNFHDDNFVLRDSAAMKERLAKLSEALRSEDVGPIAFAVKCRPDSVDSEIFGLMKAMGLFRVFVGIEAGTEISLSMLGRGHKVSDNIKALEILNSLNLQVCFNMILLNPDSTLEDLEQNVAFLRRFPANPMNFCRAEVYAGTPLEQKLRSSGRLIGDYTGYDYRIADQRAQRAFELMNRILYMRHHAQGNVHHASMILDYESHLKAHFFRMKESLKQSVREFITRVNIDSCDRLASIIRFSAEGAASQFSTEYFIEKEGRAVSYADTLFRKEYETLLLKIRGTSTRLIFARHFNISRVAAYLGIAAALTVAAPDCMPETHMCETVPAYYYTGWLDDSTYNQVGTGKPDKNNTSIVAKKSSARKNAIINAKFEIVRYIFRVELKSVEEFDRFRPGVIYGEEIMEAVRSGKIFREDYDQDGNCELRYQVTLPDMRKKVYKIQGVQTE